MPKRVTLGQLRTAQLPAPTPDDSDLLQSLRKNVDSEHPNNLVLAVPDAMWELVQSLTPAGQPAATAPDAEEGRTGLETRPTKPSRHR